MISWFTENSLVPLVAGVLLSIAFCGLAFSFRDRIMLYIAIAIAALTSITVLTESLIVTDREAIIDIVYELADCVRANDMHGVIGYVSEKQEHTIRRIRSEMPKVHFDSCRVLGVANFTTSESDHPKTSVIDFSVWAEGRRGRDGRGTVRRRVQLTFEQDADGNWWVINYSHSDPARHINL